MTTIEGSEVTRLRVAIRGLVQGVGFRPFVYRLATELGVRGWVNNNLQGVCIEAEGASDVLASFVRRLETDKPPRAAIYSIEPVFLDAVGYEGFEIRESEGEGATSAVVLPDISTCADCRREVSDPADRRFRYPFTNCTNCGPRFSIIRGLPYDRPNTSMSSFPMCEACRAEYDDPLDRRFHAQPNACPVCGPQLALWDAAGETVCERDDALLAAAEALREGLIVAVKGLGGFHLMVDACNHAAVLRLRERKRREEKPLALMYPCFERLAADCRVSASEERLLLSPESPIVLVEALGGSGISAAVAPGNPNLGVMLPYTPLHHILMADVGFPVVATSGNLSDEPICTDEGDVVQRLGGIADLFLVHNRPIVRHVDDSIVRIIAGRECVLRRARGYAPLPVRVPDTLPTILAVGAHLKNTVALAVGAEVSLSQHIGDLETEQAFSAFRAVCTDLPDLYSARPGTIACDAHPDYLSTRYAEAAGVPLVRVQHHLAHVLSCMAENEVTEPVLGVAWDGAGYGLDGTTWGGEFLRVGEEGARRLAQFRPVPLLGGDKAAREPWRVAMAMLYDVLGEAALSRDDLAPVRFCRGAGRGVLSHLLATRLRSPLASSVGRLFDGIAALLDLRQIAGFEGQAAMELEFALHGTMTEDAYEFAVTAPEGRPAPAGPPPCSAEDAPAVVDWRPVVRDVLQDIAAGAEAATISARFHNALVQAILDVARSADIEAVALSGGCFQNAYLAERAVTLLRAEGFRPYWHQRVPPNDGGIALGQVIAAASGRMWEDVPGSPGSDRQHQ